MDGRLPDVMIRHSCTRLLALFHAPDNSNPPAENVSRFHLWKKCLLYRTDSKREEFEGQIASWGVQQKVEHRHWHWHWHRHRGNSFSRAASIVSIASPACSDQNPFYQ
jgi:hypothetical protein